MLRACFVSGGCHGGNPLAVQVVSFHGRVAAAGLHAGAALLLARSVGAPLCRRTAGRGGVGAERPGLVSALRQFKVWRS